MTSKQYAPHFWGFITIFAKMQLSHNAIYGQTRLHTDTRGDQ